VAPTSSVVRAVTAAVPSAPATRAVTVSATS
jgi:hypothetical protein